MDSATPQSQTVPLWRYRPELDGLRSVAVYAVILFHAQMQWLSGGFIGVDLFFVLSGFLVTQVILAEIQRSGQFRVGAFYARRVRRLVPAAVVVVVATSLLYVLVASLPQRAEMVRDAQAALVYLANWNFIAESGDYFATETDKSPFLHFWSLSIEEQFYLAYPLVLIVLLKLRVSRVRQIALIVLLGSASLGAQLYWAGIDPTRAYYGTDSRLYQILAGAGLAMLLAGGRATVSGTEDGRSWGVATRYRPSAGLVAALGLTGLLLLTTSLVDLSTSTRGILATGASLAVIGGIFCAPTSWTSRLLALRVPVYLGKISYSTYLWHWPVILVTAMFLEVRPLVLFIIAAALATGLAALSMELVETPIRRLRLLPVMRWPVAVGGLVVGLLVAGLAVGPILDSERAPVTARDTSGPSLEGSGVLAARAAELRRPVPKDLDYESIAHDRGLRDTWCTAGSTQGCLIQEGDGRPTVVLIGDSHARMIAPAFQALANEKGFRLYASIVSSCPWQAGLINENADVGHEAACREGRSDFYDKTLPEMDPDVVVLASYSRTEKSWEGGLVDDEGLDLPLHALQQRTSERTVERIAEAGARTVIVKTVMGTAGWDKEGWDPLDCLARAETMVDCAVVPPAERPIVDSFYDDLAVSREDVSTVDLNSVVCPGAPLCAPMIEGRVVWRNVNHLTGAITRFVRDDIWQQMADGGALAAFD